MGLVTITTAAAANIPIPTAGRYTFFFDSSNSNHLSKKDSAGTVTDLEDYAVLGHTHLEADITDLTHLDPDAIHDNVTGEIAALAEKTAPVIADKLLIEDSAAGHAKKFVKIQNLPAGTAPPHAALHAQGGSDQLDAADAGLVIARRVFA